MAPRPVAPVDGEGVGLEGPSVSESVDTELVQFESDRLDRHHLGSSLNEVEAPMEVQGEDGAAPELAKALARPEALAQAVLFAEVLGKPKALRGRMYHAR